MPVFKCPNDILARDPFLNGGPLSYSMPISWGPDPLNATNRYLAPGDSALSGNYNTLNRGIGQLFNGPGAYPMWIKTGMLRAASLTLLLVERSYSEAAQCTNWNLGYQVSNPANQMWSAGGAYGFPMLHTSKGHEKQARFNYLFCDNHVDLLMPSQTVHDQSTLLPGGWEGGDYMWTIDPLRYSNSY
jgi:prepilin-type processing-associated H-X9-DG protein